MYSQCFLLINYCIRLCHPNKIDLPTLCSNFRVTPGVIFSLPVGRTLMSRRTVHTPSSLSSSTPITSPPTWNQVDMRGFHSKMQASGMFSPLCSLCRWTGVQTMAAPKPTLCWCCWTVSRECRISLPSCTGRLCQRSLTKPPADGWGVRYAQLSSDLTFSSLSPIQLCLQSISVFGSIRCEPSS